MRRRLASAALAVAALLVAAPATPAAVGSWTQAGGPTGVVADVGFSAGGSTAYAAVSGAFLAGGGMWRSLDGAATFAAGTGLGQDTQVSVVAAHPTDAGVAWAGTRWVPPQALGGSVYRTLDGGATWTALATQPGPLCSAAVSARDITALAVDPTAPSLLLAGLDSQAAPPGFDPACDAARGVWRQTAAGATPVLWTQDFPQGAPRSLAIAPDNGSYVFAGLQADGLWNAFYRSTNGGGGAPFAWTAIGALDPGPVRAIAIDPADPALLLAGVDAAGIYRAGERGGGAWSPSSGGLQGAAATVNDIAIRPGGTGVAYAATDLGVFRSLDRGLTWQPLPGLPAASTQALAVALHPGAPGTVLVGTAEGAFTQMFPPPALSAVTAAVLGPTSASISARIDGRGTPASGRVEYGPPGALGSTAPLTPRDPAGDPGDLTATLPGLKAGTAYAYRVVATSAEGVVASDVLTFSTPPAGPDLTEPRITRRTATTVSVAATVNPNGEDTTWHFELAAAGAAGAPRRTVDADAGNAADPQPATATFDGLEPGSDYVVRLVASNRLGTTTAGRAFRTSVTQVGTPGDDALTGGPLGDTISGLGGDDALKGLAGNDVLRGGSGDDTLTGGRELRASRAERNVLEGGAGNDTITVRGNRDAARGGSGKDTIVALVPGSPTVDCGSGRDTAIVGKLVKVRNCEIVKRIKRKVRF